MKFRSGAAGLASASGSNGSGKLVPAISSIEQAIAQSALRSAAFSGADPWPSQWPAVEACGASCIGAALALLMPDGINTSASSANSFQTVAMASN